MKLSGIAPLISLLWVIGCSIPAPTPFYQAKLTGQQPPGMLIRMEPYAPPVKDAAAYRVLYVSTDTDGRSIPVSGVIYVPQAPAPFGGRNVVAWAHPTTGVAPGCAPSLDHAGLGMPSLATTIPGLKQFIAAGDVVAATDYPGLGAAGVHPYLIGVAEGRALIDSVRAAGGLPGADLSGKYVVWGHSQGGQAALFAGQIAKDYAPALDLVGVAAAAPPTDMTQELTAPFQSASGRLLAAYTYYTWATTYHVPITTIVAPQAIPAMDNAVSKCLGTLGQAISAVHAASALDPVFRTHPPQSTPPWPALLMLNSPGHEPPGAPLLVLQGSDDTTVQPHYTRDFVATACAKRETVDYQELPGVSHLFVAYKSVPVVTAWIKDRFAGVRPPDNCKG